jgi:hypothetical protein
MYASKIKRRERGYAIMRDKGEGQSEASKIVKRKFY